MKNIMKKNREDKCLVTEKGFFGKSYSHYEHTWVYKSKEERVCEKCGRTEIYFGFVSTRGADSYEDWRKKLN